MRFLSIKIILLAIAFFSSAFRQDDRHWLPRFDIGFAQRSAVLYGSEKNTLKEVGFRMHNIPDSKVVIEGSKSRNRIENIRNHARVNAVLEYLTDTEQTDRARFLVKYDGAANANTVICRMPYDGEE